MNLSDKTFTILKNFASINGNILIEEGNSIKTVNEAQSIFAKAILSDTFPVKFGIFDLGEFLNVINLLGGPENTDLDFQEKKVLLTNKNGTIRVQYWYASEKVLKFPEKTINMPEVQASFEILGSSFIQLKKAASTFGHPKLAFYNTSKNPRVIMGKTFDPQVSSSNLFEMNVAEVQEDIPIFEYIFDIQNLRYLALDSSSSFDVNLASKGKGKITEFTDGTIFYYVAVDSSSTMG